jgi:hypothetical protein
MQITTNGRDDLGAFTVLLPGHCASCDTDTDVVLKYPNRQELARALEQRGIEFNFTKTHVILHKSKREIGVTCGCYAKWQRQVAHISRKREGRVAKP